MIIVHRKNILSSPISIGSIYFRYSIPYLNKLVKWPALPQKAANVIENLQTCIEVAPIESSGKPGDIAIISTQFKTSKYSPNLTKIHKKIRRATIYRIYAQNGEMGYAICLSLCQRSSWLMYSFSSSSFYTT